ncbi:hypothetical protein [Paenibacillus alvei]|uniref:Uncharacterized protein n=1 Tax=Paenibacillus alvei TaxID=44250 RepID=A0AAP7A0T4_PAEAL|nr:hypothetical protein [Paenibacillus alvei]NOJ73575.1 hypothetical protein [Paenibacillus alvei]
MELTVESIAYKMREISQNDLFNVMAYTLGLIHGVVEVNEDGTESQTIDLIKNVYAAYEIVVEEFPSVTRKILN